MTSPSQQLWQPTWTWLRGAEAVKNNVLLEQCADLFSRDYGKWGPKGPRPGQAIRRSSADIKALLLSNDARLACAFNGAELVGYCTALQVPTSEGLISWVTQMVVAAAYRDSGIATLMMYSIWQFSDCYAWGLVSAHPYAIRALETATHRPCRAGLISKHGPAIAERLHESVEYIPPSLVPGIRSRYKPVVDTEFYVDHSDLEELKKAAARPNRRWNLGSLDEGEEWFACTFRTQPPAAIDGKTLNTLLRGSDRIWIQAYEGMTLDQNHAWHNHAPEEVAVILDKTTSPEGSSVLDVGCGDGRHVHEFRSRGFNAVGIDISGRLIDRALSRGIPAEALRQGDCREVEQIPDGPFELIVCLYDVLGSSSVEEDDLAILRGCRSRMSASGFLVGTVLNTATTLPYLPETALPETVEDLVVGLEQLPPSIAMESSGSIFDTSRLLYYDDVYYRKEQFTAATWQLPSELVVRDRRYSDYTLRPLLQRAGFDVESIIPVQAGAWDRNPVLEETDMRARELLFIARPAKTSG